MGGRCHGCCARLPGNPWYLHVVDLCGSACSGSTSGGGSCLADGCFVLFPRSVNRTLAFIGDPPKSKPKLEHTRLAFISALHLGDVVTYPVAIDHF